MYCPGQLTTYAVLRASHVCHHWREVTHRSPHLRNHLLLGLHPEFNRLVLERSKDCALYVSTIAGHPYHAAVGLPVLFGQTVRYYVASVRQEQRRIIPAERPRMCSILDLLLALLEVGCN